MRCLTYGATLGQARRTLLLCMKARHCRLPWCCCSPSVCSKLPLIRRQEPRRILVCRSHQTENPASERSEALMSPILAEWRPPLTRLDFELDLHDGGTHATPGRMPDGESEASFRRLSDLYRSAQGSPQPDSRCRIRSAWASPTSRLPLYVKAAWTCSVEVKWRFHGRKWWKNRGTWERWHPNRLVDVFLYLVSYHG